jgi:hypothetical protein
MSFLLFYDLSAVVLLNVVSWTVFMMETPDVVWAG